LKRPCGKEEKAKYKKERGRESQKENEHK